MTKIYRLILLPIPLILVLLPANYFDQGTVVCLSKRLFDVECWGCGLTRAIQHLFHFDWEIAWQYNPRVYIVAPLLAYLYVKEMRLLYQQLISSNNQENHS